MNNASLRRRPSSSLSWEEKEITLDALPDKIPNGSNVYIGSGASTPQASLQALVQSYLQDIQILQMIPGGQLPHLGEHPDSFRTKSFFSFTKTTYYQPDQQQDLNHNHEDKNGNHHPPVNGAHNHTSTTTTATTESLADYSPISISAVPRLLRENMLHVDVALIKVSVPHKGFCSLGMGVEFTPDFIQHATRLVIAEVTPHMPWTEGPSKIPLEHIDYWIGFEKDDPKGRLWTTEELWPEFAKRTFRNAPFQEISNAIGKNVITLIPDGATLKFGISILSFCVFPFLHQRKDLGLHTDVYTESLYQLQRDGVITNSCKTIHTGRTVVSSAHGSQALYDFVDRNPAVEFHPSSYINDPQVMAQHDNFIAIVGALKVDLTGQVATESIAHKFYGGVWSDGDSVKGARMSRGGKSIVSLPAKSMQGRSNVVFALPQGTGVSITRADVEYVVTEYGTAYLYGKSIRERCLALIDIAHPDFRSELLAQAKANHYISSSQPGLSFASRYPQHLECRHETKKTHKIVFCRPIKAVDEDLLRLFFHKLSNHSVYLRYFRKIKSLPQRILQKTADVDYVSNMALVVLYPPEDAAHQELVGLAQWIQDKHDGVHEISFQVRDDWQGEGLGKFLFARLVAVAREFGLDQFKADVLADNKAMRGVFESSGVPCTQKTDFGVVTYMFDLAAARPSKAGEEFFDCRE